MNLVTLLNGRRPRTCARWMWGCCWSPSRLPNCTRTCSKNPHVAQIRIDIPDGEERLRFLQSGWAEAMADGKPFSEWSDFSAEERPPDRRPELAAHPASAG